MPPVPEIEFEVAYVGASMSFVRVLTAPASTTIEGALAIACDQYGALHGVAGIRAEVAVHGERVQNRSRRLQAGDRLEILRPLLTEPADARRARAMKP
ncbi:MAG: RnfH family protein [Gammaproteobacteria bacterium]|nr:RnfH family protein [Gammaproteobacteria bacterium]MCY4199605.1 RnfH family protein [Gammaproteobacteria bacterium]MCY4278746.1 RnfH family protein [Gammaproteobacteria bacterium]MCY4322188.1 RnfH family protein [Gammaproteobacteria bacterium]